MAGEPILIIDDNAVNLKLIRVLLQNEGYSLQTAANAEQAQEILKTFKPSLILMDLQLPGMDGFALTQRLKSHPDTRHIKILAVTAYAMKGDDNRVKEAGCDGYLTKPIDTRTFAKTVADLLLDGK
jgi:two-component system, cell cycle response regulator DivK